MGAQICYELAGIVLKRNGKYCTLLLYERRWFFINGQQVERHKHDVSIDTRGEYELLLFRRLNHDGLSRRLRNENRI